MASEKAGVLIKLRATTIRRSKRFRLLVTLSVLKAALQDFEDFVESSKSSAKTLRKRLCLRAEVSQKKTFSFSVYVHVFLLDCNKVWTSGAMQQLRPGVSIRQRRILMRDMRSDSYESNAHFLSTSMQKSMIQRSLTYSIEMLSCDVVRHTGSMRWTVQLCTACTSLILV